MLKPTGVILVGNEIIDIGMFTRVESVCLDSGAQLTRSNGIPNWTLILPDNVPATRQDFFRHSSWTHRSQFKAPNLAAAIRIGNERLPGLLKRQQKEQSRNVPPSRRNGTPNWKRPTHDESQ
jgi:hypothetical protein